jgi:hypothetical protein
LPIAAERTAKTESALPAAPSTTRTTSTDVGVMAAGHVGGPAPAFDFTAAPYDPPIFLLQW